MAINIYETIRKRSKYYDRTQCSNYGEWAERVRDSKAVYVGNLSVYTTDREIFEHMSRVGPVNTIVMGLHRLEKTPCGFCFVEYKSPISCSLAVLVLNESILDGRSLKVDEDIGIIGERKYGRGVTGVQRIDERLRKFDFDRPIVINNITKGNILNVILKENANNNTGVHNIMGNIKNTFNVYNSIHNNDNNNYYYYYNNNDDDDDGDDDIINNSINNDSNYSSGFPNGVNDEYSGNCNKNGCNNNSNCSSNNSGCNNNGSNSNGNGEEYDYSTISQSRTTDDNIIDLVDIEDMEEDEQVLSIYDRSISICETTFCESNSDITNSDIINSDVTNNDMINGNNITNSTATNVEATNIDVTHNDIINGNNNIRNSNVPNTHSKEEESEASIVDSFNVYSNGVTYNNREIFDSDEDDFDICHMYYNHINQENDSNADSSDIEDINDIRPDITSSDLFINDSDMDDDDNNDTYNNENNDTYNNANNDTYNNENNDTYNNEDEYEDEGDYAYEDCAEKEHEKFKDSQEKMKLKSDMLSQNDESEKKEGINGEKPLYPNLLHQYNTDNNSSILWISVSDQNRQKDEVSVPAENTNE